MSAVDEDRYYRGLDQRAIALDRAVAELERELRPFNAVERVAVTVVLDQLVVDCEWHRNSPDHW